MHSVLMDDACILKTHVFMQRWCDIAIVVLIIKSPHLAYSVDNRQHSTSATLNIGLNIGFSEHRPSEQSAKCNIGQALVRVIDERMWHTSPILISALIGFRHVYRLTAALRLTYLYQYLKISPGYVAF